ncbi:MULTISPECIES: hypothetical protein [unclassified Paenibacillus]|uniref:hypothetical protein n=2 Tax=unclassified Paenibacillus TaxID=185978 RepID=UPI002405FEF3|nr:MULTISPECIES: hypothetical protein [unclassified Paenibacillus]
MQIRNEANIIIIAFIKRLYKELIHNLNSFNFKYSGQGLEVIRKKTGASVMRKLISIAQRLVKRTQEIDAIKEERHSLFSKIEANEEQIIQSHYEMEFKRLECMYLKLEQIKEWKNHTDVYDAQVYQQQLKRMEAITERCISSILKRLFEGGYGQELKRRGLVKDYIEASPPLSPQGCVIQGEFVHKSSLLLSIPHE